MSLLEKGCFCLYLCPIDEFCSVPSAGSHILPQTRWFTRGKNKLPTDVAWCASIFGLEVAAKHNHRPWFIECTRPNRSGCPCRRVGLHFEVITCVGSIVHEHTSTSALVDLKIPETFRNGGNSRSDKPAKDIKQLFKVFKLPARCAHPLSKQGKLPTDRRLL